MVSLDAVETTTISIDAILLFLSAIALGIRLISRRIQGHRLSLNDYLALLAWVKIPYPKVGKQN